MQDAQEPKYLGTMARPTDATSRKPEQEGPLGGRVPLISIMGFRVLLDPSWFFLALLISWSLASAFFPSRYPGRSPPIYWSMGVAGTIGLLVSLIFHELSHSLVARRHGLAIRGITLFIFGGVAEMVDEPASPKAEFAMAIAGPIASLGLAIAFQALTALGDAFAWPVPVLAVARYLATINLMLALFNLVPAYPLDGGRILRAGLWRWKGNIDWATQRAARVGSGFGLLLMMLGLLYVIVTDNFVGGVWWFLIGLFLRGAAKASYVQLLTRHALAGATVAQFMTRNPIFVPPEITIEQLVEHYVYEHHHEQFPVVEAGRLVGLVSTRQIRQLPRTEWPTRRVEEIMSPRSETNCIDAGVEAAQALNLMKQSGNGWLMVVAGDELVGVVTLRDFLTIIQLKVDFEASP